MLQTIVYEVGLHHHRPCDYETDSTGTRRLDPATDIGFYNDFYNDIARAGLVFIRRKSQLTGPDSIRRSNEFQGCGIDRQPDVDFRMLQRRRSRRKPHNIVVNVSLNKRDTWCETMFKHNRARRAGPHAPTPPSREDARNDVLFFNKVAYSRAFPVLAQHMKQI